MSCNLSDDLITEILLRLPVKQLLRCKAVSKLWLSLISTPSFVKSHLSIALALAKSNPILIVNSNDDDSDTSISLLNLSSSQTVANLAFPYSQPNEPLVDQGNLFESLIIGSACGIVCVRSIHSDIFLWNPATNHSKLIPPPVLDDSGMFRASLGFGYDEINNDFKLVRILQPFLYSEIYSANTNVWRIVEAANRPIDIPSLVNNFEVCVDGFLCSVGSRHGMMSFDLNKEFFTCAINLPVTTFGTTFRDIKDSVADDARLTDFNKSIAVIISKNTENGCKMNLWMLDDKACFRGGGIEASWTLMLNIDFNLPVVFVHGYFNNGNLLLLDDDYDWCLYNSVTKEFKDISGSFLAGQVFKYMESLVSIPGSKSVIQPNQLESS